MIFPFGDYNVLNTGLFSWKNTVINNFEKPRIKHGFALITEGKFIINTEEKVIEAVKGDLLFLPLNSRYKTQIDYASSYILNFSSPDLDYPIPMKLFSNADEKYEKYFEQLINLARNGDSEFLIKSTFYKLLDHIVKDIAGIKPEKECIREAKKLIESDNDYSISKIAEICMISESGLRRQFKETYGVSPNEYKMKIKIEKAKFLFESTELSVTQVSLRLNFYDTAYFSKIFKKYTGYTPLHYRQNKTGALL